MWVELETKPLNIAFPFISCNSLVLVPMSLWGCFQMEGVLFGRDCGERGICTCQDVCCPSFSSGINWDGSMYAPTLILILFKQIIVPAPFLIINSLSHVSMAKAQRQVLTRINCTILISGRKESNHTHAVRRKSELLLKPELSEYRQWTSKAVLNNPGGRHLCC